MCWLISAGTAQMALSGSFDQHGEDEKIPSSTSGKHAMASRTFDTETRVARLWSAIFTITHVTVLAQRQKKCMTDKLRRVQ